MTKHHSTFTADNKISDQFQTLSLLEIHLGHLVSYKFKIIYLEIHMLILYINEGYFSQR